VHTWPVVRDGEVGDDPGVLLRTFPDTPRWAGPSGRGAALAACVGFMLVWHAVLVLARELVPDLRPAFLPTLGATLANALVLVVTLGVVLVLGWGRDTGTTTWRVRDAWLLVPPLVVALSWAGPRGVEAAAVLPLAVRMIFVGAAEEIAARGVYLRLLAPWGPGRACVLSGLVFGLSHVGNVLFFGQSWPVTAEMMVVAVLFGTVYAALRLRVEALWPLVLLHAVNNTAEYASVQPPPLWFKAAVGVAALGYAWWLLRPVTDVVPPHRRVR
jgi:hypothetical protein